jgi:hypothetical protein
MDTSAAVGLMQPTRIPFTEGAMFMKFLGGVLAVLAGLFYLAGNHEIGSMGTTMCQYGYTFCDHPSYVLVGAVLAGLWGQFVSIS